MTNRLELWLIAVPMELAWESPETNVVIMARELEKWLAHVKSELPRVACEALLFVFPEMTLTGFVTEQPGRVALKCDDSWVLAAQELAKRYGVALSFGYPEAGSSGEVYNRQVLIAPDGNEVAAYRKMHLFTVGKPAESETYTPGESGTLVTYRGWKLGFGICFDLRFPGLFQAYAEQGVDAILLPACWVAGPYKTEQLRSLAAGHAISCQSYFLAMSRMGKDPAFSYAGEVFVFGPKGDCLSESAPVRLEQDVIEAVHAIPVRTSRRASYPIILK